MQIKQRRECSRDQRHMDLFHEQCLTFAILFRRLARAVEEARLESVYTPKGYRGLESLSLRFFFYLIITSASTPLNRMFIPFFIHLACIVSKTADFKPII